MSQEKDQKKSNAYDLRAVLEEIELDLIRNLRRNLKRHEKEEEEEGFRWEMWQKTKLRSIAKYRKKNNEIVGERSKEIEELINKTLQENFDTAESMMQKLFRKVKSFFTRRGMQYPKDISNRGLEKRELPEEDFFDVNEKKIDALQETAQKVQEPQKTTDREAAPANAEEAFKPAGEEKELTGKDNDQKLDDLKKQVNTDMKEVEGVIWRRMDDIYRQTIYKTEMFMAAGAKSLDQAIDMATKEFLDGGIDCIEYSNGRRVNIASYAEMALRTASQRATFLAEGKKRDEWVIHTIFVSAHANTCPKCEPWQGKVLVDDVFSSGTATEAAALGVPLLSTAMKAGLLHPNCRHTLATYFPGITILPKVPNKDKALKTYEAEQKQRALERRIRKAKRKVAGACDNDNIRKAQAELRDLQRQIREHMDQHPELRREYNREKIYETKTDGKPKDAVIKAIKIPGEVYAAQSIPPDIVADIQAGVDEIEQGYNVKIHRMLAEDGGLEHRTVPFYVRYVDNRGMNEVEFIINKEYNFTNIRAIIQAGYEAGYFAGKTVKDQVIHEMAHAMTGQQYKTSAAFNDYADRLQKQYVAGVSGYSDECKNGFETIAETFVRMRNHEPVPEAARKLVEKHIERWRKQ